MRLFWRACKNFLQFSNFDFLTSTNTSAPLQHHPQTISPNRPQNLRSDSLKSVHVINYTKELRKWLRTAKNSLLANITTFYYNQIYFSYMVLRKFIYAKPQIFPNHFSNFDFRFRDKIAEIKKTKTGMMAMFCPAPFGTAKVHIKIYLDDFGGRLRAAASFGGGKKKEPKKKID